MDLIGSLLSSKPVIEIILDDERYKQKFRNLKGDYIEFPVYYDTDNIKGRVVVHLNKIKNFEHNGIKVEFIGVIENYMNKKLTSKFITLSKDLDPPGVLDNENTQLEFEFNNIEKLYETFRGKNIAVRYYLLTTIHSKYKNITKEQEFVVIKPHTKIENEKENNPPLYLEVGVEDWIHVSFQVNKSRFHLRDIVEGQVNFKKVSVKLQSMELQIIKKEITGSGK